MKKRMISLLLSAALAAGMLSGCGGAAQSSQSAAPADSSAAATSAQSEQPASSTPAGEPVTLTILSTLITENEAPLEQAMADAYMAKNPNVKVKFVGQAVNDMAKKIIALNTSDDLPDAFFMPTEFMSQAYDMDIIVDHEKLLGADFIATIDEKVVEYGKIENKLMMVPWHVIPVATVYRPDWLKDAGLTSLTTMDDFKAAAKAFTKDGRWGFSMVGTNNGSGQARFTQFVRAYGVNEIYKDANGKWASDIGGDAYKQALTDFVNLALVDGVVPPGPTETGYPEAAAYFAEEKTGLMITGSNAIGAIESANPELKGKLASAPIPKQQRHLTNLQTSGYAITTGCENPEAMADYLKFITSPEIAMDFALNSGRLPVNKEALANPQMKEGAFAGFIDCMQYALPQPAFPAYGELLDIMGESYNTMLGNNVSIDDAMAKVNSRLETLLAEHNK